MTDQPDLEELATELGEAEEEYKLDQIMPTLYEKFAEHNKNPDGSFKKEFTDKESDAIADDLFDALSYHIHINIYKFTPKKWEELKNKLGPSGEPYADSSVEKYFRIDREGLKKLLKQQVRLDNEILARLLEENIRHHTTAIEKPIIDKYELKEEHTPYLKEWTGSKITKYHLSPERMKALRKAETLRDALQHYRSIAKQHYKKGHGEEPEETT